MDIKGILKANRVNITGTLVEYGLEVKTGQDGNEYISGQVVIRSEINGRTQLTPVDFFSKSVTAEGKPNKLFDAYVNLEDKLEQRVKIDGELSENRYFSTITDQMSSYVRVNGRFINTPKEKDVDQVSFEFAGFVSSVVAERLNKENELIHHEIFLTEANYNGTMPNTIKFAVKNEKIAKVMSDLYEKGLTVKVVGEYLIESATDVFEEETAFGETIKKERTSTFRSFVITSGTNPADQGAYTPEMIKELEDAFAERENRLLSEAKEGRASKGNTSTANVKVNSDRSKLL